MNKTDIINEINNFDLSARIAGVIFGVIFLYFFASLCIYIINNKELNRKYVLSGTFLTLFLLFIEYIIISMIIFAKDILRFISNCK